MPERRITERDIERFTCGDCHILAYALHDLTGWEVATFDGDLHAFVHLPDGRYADVNGIQTEDELREEWDDVDIPIALHGSRIDDPDWEVGPFYGAYSRRRAKRLAPYIASLA